MVPPGQGWGLLAGQRWEAHSAAPSSLINPDKQGEAQSTETQTWHFS